MSNHQQSSAGKFTVREVEDRTGVPASTLRQWERRYGFPDPQRSESGYRYYSEGDVASIVRMRELVADGVQPSRAAALMLDAQQPSSGVRSVEVLSRELVDALRRLDAERADLLLTEVLTLYPVDTALFDVIRPTLVRIGDLWHAGELSVAVEHFASNFLQGRLRGLLGMLPPAGRGYRVVVTCAPGERHEMGAMILAIMLKRFGFRVVYLGADTPVADLAKLTAEQGFDAVLLSATSPEALVGIRESRTELRALGALLVLGGEGLAGQPELAADVGGVFLGNDVRKVVPELEALLRKSRHATVG